MDICAWLRGLGLERYEQAFRDNAIDEAILPKLTAEDLKDLGVTAVGHRRILLDASAALRGEPVHDTAQHSADPGRSGGKAPEAERRQLTVMFADLIGSTALSARLDPEELRDIIGAYHRRCAEVITGSGGFVAKYLGDGVLAYFGYPQAHEEDAERAVRAGLALVEAVAKLKVGQATSLQVRVGVATGLVVVGDLLGEGAAQEQAVIGETPNLAARLQGLAEPNTVVIADDTRRLLGGLFDYCDRGTLPIAGIDYPVQVWRVVGASLVGSRFEALRAASTPLIGREEEIALLTRRWERARAGDGSVVLIVGEPGIGKSRIAQTLLEQLGNEPHTRLRYFCSPQHQDSALQPIIAQLERAAGFAREDTPEAKLEKLAALLAPAAPPPEDEALLAELLSLPTEGCFPPLSLAPPEKKEKTFEALLRQLGGLARQHPVLMILEDAHWSDPSSRELFDHVVDGVRALPVLLVVTFRPEYAPPWVGQAHVTTLTLNRLDRAAGVALVRRIAGNKDLPDEIVAKIVERTDGVPLFVEELTKSALESGANDHGASFIARAPHPALAIPATLHASLMARLDRIGAVAKEVAQIGAAIGREFSYDMLASAARRSDSELRAALDRLIGAGLVFRRGEPPGASFLFKHALVQDAAYGTLLRGPRRELHARIACVLEERLATAAEVQPEILAHHCANAGLTEKAVFYWQEAGERSKARSAMAEAIRQMRKALDLLSHLPDTPGRQRTEVGLQLALGGALIAAKGHAAEETGKAYARARHLCELLNDTPNLLKALWGVFVHHHVRAETNLSHRAAEELLDLAGRQSDTATLVAGHRAVGDSWLHRGELGAARAHLEQGLALYDPARHRSLTVLFAENARVATLSFLSLTLGLLGFADQAQARSSEALADARELSHPISLAFALSVACRLHFVLGDPRIVRLRADELIALTTAQGFAFFLAMGTAYRGWTLVEAGEAEPGMDLLRRGIEGFKASGAAWTLPFYLAQLATGHAKMGRPEDGLGWLSEALVLTGRSGVRWFEAELHRIRGELLRTAHPGATAEAEADFHRAITVARRQDAKLWELRAATSLARLWRDRGKRDEARALVAPVYGWFTEGFDTPDLKEAKALLDELSA
jgi:class 3 adenylate cyclase/predicted ATPase